MRASSSKATCWRAGSGMEMGGKIGIFFTILVFVEYVHSKFAVGHVKEPNLLRCFLSHPSGRGIVGNNSESADFSCMWVALGIARNGIPFFRAKRFTILMIL